MCDLALEKLSKQREQRATCGSIGSATDLQTADNPSLLFPHNQLTSASSYFLFTLPQAEMHVTKVSSRLFLLLWSSLAAITAAEGILKITGGQLEQMSKDHRALLVLTGFIFIQYQKINTNLDL